MTLSSSVLNNEYKLSLWPQLILLSIAQLFNHWMDRSLKIFAVYVHSDLGISLSTLSYILAYGSYGPLIVLVTSHYYHYFQSNMILFAMELTAAITMLLVYFYGYQIVWLLFICRLLFSSSIKGIFTYTNTMIAYYVSNKQDIIHYVSIFNSAFVVSTFLFLLTGYLLNKNNGLFDYLLIYSIIAIVFSVILLIIMPTTKTELNTQSQIINLENSFSKKISQLFCNNIRYVLLLLICFFEQISQSIYSIIIGVFVKVNYGSNPLQLGLYMTLTQGIAQLIGISCIAFIFGKYIKKNYFIWIFSSFELIIYIIFYVMIWNHQQIYIESCLFMMFFVSLGHMGLYYGLVIVLIETVPSYQQSVASSIWSVVDILGGSFGTFIVGKIAADHANQTYDIGLYSMMLLISYCCCIVSVTMWCYKSYETQKRKIPSLNTQKTRYHSVDSVEIKI